VQTGGCDQPFGLVGKQKTRSALGLARKFKPGRVTPSTLVRMQHHGSERDDNLTGVCRGTGAWLQHRGSQSRDRILADSREGKVIGKDVSNSGEACFGSRSSRHCLQIAPHRLSKRVSARFRTMPLTPEHLGFESCGFLAGESEGIGLRAPPYPLAGDLAAYRKRPCAPATNNS
jgi:hypothetical protein